MTAPRAHRVGVAADEPLIGPGRYHYADAFEIRLHERDPRSAEEFARCALEQAPWLVRGVVLIAQRSVLRVKLGPRSAPDHVFGWKIVMSERDVIKLEAISPLLGEAVLVARRPDATTAIVTTYIFYARPTAARVLWTIVGPLHRWVARYMLEHAAASAPQPEPAAAVDR
jgi:hypothetical protein